MGENGTFRVILSESYKLRGFPQVNCPPVKIKFTLLMFLKLLWQCFWVRSTNTSILYFHICPLFCFNCNLYYKSNHFDHASLKILSLEKMSMKRKTEMHECTIFFCRYIISKSFTTQKGPW